MSPHDQPSKPAKIPDDLWHEIQRVKERMLTFLVDAQHTAEDEERAGTFDPAFYAWLEPMATAVQQLQAIKRTGPHTKNVIPFAQNFGRAAPR